MPDAESNLVRSRSDDVIEIYMDVAMERYEAGESLASLAEEAGIPEADLIDCLVEEGLLGGYASNPYQSLEGDKEGGPEPCTDSPPTVLHEAAQRTSGPKYESGIDEILAQLPHDEIVKRYQEGGESLPTIVAALRSRNLPASKYYLKLILAGRGILLRERKGRPLSRYVSNSYPTLKDDKEGGHE